MWQKQKSELSNQTGTGKKFRYMALVVQEEYEENKDLTLAKLGKMMSGQILEDSKVASLVAIEFLVIVCQIKIIFQHSASHCLAGMVGSVRSSRSKAKSTCSFW